MAKKKKAEFDPKDPFPPYPPPEKQEKRPEMSDIDWGWMASVAAADAHGLYPAEVEQQDAFESGYLQAVQDIEEHFGGGAI